LPISPICRRVISRRSFRRLRRRGRGISRLSNASVRRYCRFPTLKSQSRLIAQDETESISRSTRLLQRGAGLNAKSPSVDISIEAEEY
jgi:hypothetical protein